MTLSHTDADNSPIPTSSHGHRARPPLNAGPHISRPIPPPPSLLNPPPCHPLSPLTHQPTHYPFHSLPPNINLAAPPHPHDLSQYQPPHLPPNPPPLHTLPFLPPSLPLTIPPPPPYHPTLPFLLPPPPPPPPSPPPPPPPPTSHLSPPPLPPPSPSPPPLSPPPLPPPSLPPPPPPPLPPSLPPPPSSLPPLIPPSRSPFHPSSPHFPQTFSSPNGDVAHIGTATDVFFCNLAMSAVRRRQGQCRQRPVHNSAQTSERTMTMAISANFNPGAGVLTASATPPERDSRQPRRGRQDPRQRRRRAHRGRHGDGRQHRR